jgi:Ca2+-binding EF-hand superfamily protein
MTREQFRNIMGLLGQNKDPFLTDRIFDIFDEDSDDAITFEQFTHIMDILCNGSEDERN